MKSLPLLLLGLLSVQSDPVVDAVVKEGRTNSQAMAHLEHLCWKIGPRLTSSSRLTQACEWAREEFEKWGLKARLEEWGTFPVGFDRGPWSARMLEPEERALTICTPSWSAGTDGPVVGPAILAPETDDQLKDAKEKLKGAWVVSTARGADKYQVAYDEAGVAGIIRSSGSELIVTSGNSRISWDNLPKRVIVQMMASQHKAVVDHLKAGKGVKLSIQIKNTFVQGPIKLYNVIADLPGSEKPDEYVIVGGHIDSWDGAQGCTDNGTGTATTMEAARLLAKAGAKPKRTIRFMLWSGEEQGLLGSRAWVKAHPDEMMKISGVFVHDMGTNFVSGVPATEAIYPLFEKVFKPVLGLDDELKFTLRKVTGLPRFGGSDHFSFLQAGVPGFFWDQKGTAAKAQRYQHEHHTQHDTYEAAIPEFQRHSSMVIALAAWGVANLDELLPRDKLLAPAQPGAAAGQRRLLGVQCDDELVIAEISEGSPADKAGLKAGDKILKIADQAVTDLQSLRDAIQKAPKETKVALRRDGKEVLLPVAFPQ